MVFSLSVSRLTHPRSVMMITTSRRTVMYQVSSAIHPPVRPQTTPVKQQLLALENCFKELEATHTPMAGSDSIHRRRLIYLLESNAKKLKQFHSSS